MISPLNPSTITANAFPTSIASAHTASRVLSRQLDATNSSTPSICANPPLDSCAFYADCLESKYNCGLDGYPIGYGQHFCEKFRTDRTELSTAGQEWMLNTMLCLQRTLIPEATSAAGVTCASLEMKAFASHGRCYVESGLCTLPPTDWLAIVRIVEIKTVFASKDSLLATLSAGEGCLELYLFFIRNLLF
ncbi:hypothetical protein FPV67DRAFT_1102693 [Lyophyllum atratum]|nr:hypothetical protein FPV67DRAFT_1102693 [Lyophyllum atratum]